jgi:cytochrome P450
MATLPGPTDRAFGLRLARRMQTDMLSFSEELAAEFGDLAFFRVGPLKICLLNHPELIHEALSTRVKSFPKYQRPIRQLAKMDGQAITVTEGDGWLRGRRVVQPAFHADRFEAYGEIVVRATSAMAERWDRQATIDAESEFRRLTLQTMTQTLLGDEAASQAEVIGGASREFLSIISRELYRPFDLPDWLPLPSKFRKRRAVRQVREFVERVIAVRRAEGGRGDDLLSLLLHAADQEGTHRRLSNRQALDEAIGLFRAGHDAMSSCSRGPQRSSVSTQRSRPKSATKSRLSRRGVPSRPAMLHVFSTSSAWSKSRCGSTRRLGCCSFARRLRTSH